MRAKSNNFKLLKTADFLLATVCVYVCECVCVCVSHSVVSNSVTPWAVAHQAPPNESISQGGYMCLDGQDLQNCIYLAPNLKELLECRCHRKGEGIHRK